MYTTNSMHTRSSHHAGGQAGWSSRERRRFDDSLSQSRLGRGAAASPPTPGAAPPPRPPPRPPPLPPLYGRPVLMHGWMDGSIDGMATSMEEDARGEGNRKRENMVGREQSSDDERRRWNSGTTTKSVGRSVVVGGSRAS
eukprot:GHVU01022938.1.p1 GENE.GHVU01022938.1~~GHVU01022938.1.p1  ORF type:complete len:140 (-),score=17.67 GHVU01022938.1:589-1008(-)